MKTKDIKRLKKLESKFYNYANNYQKNTYIVGKLKYVKNMMGKEFFEVEDLRKKAVSYLMMAIDFGHHKIDTARELRGYEINSKFEFVTTIQSTDLVKYQAKLEKCATLTPKGPDELDWGDCALPITKEIEDIVWDDSSIKIVRTIKGGL